MASRRSQFQEDARLRVLRLIGANPNLSSRQIAARVGISNGSAYYIISALIRKGLVKIQNFKSNPKKTQYSYLLTGKGINEKSALTYRFIRRKRKEFEALKEEIKALEIEVKADVNKDRVVH